MPLSSIEHDAAARADLARVSPHLQTEAIRHYMFYYDGRVLAHLPALAALEAEEGRLTGAYRPPQCAGGGGGCAALFKHSEAYARGVIEEQLARSGLNISIAFTAGGVYAATSAWVALMAMSAQPT